MKKQFVCLPRFLLVFSFLLAFIGGSTCKGPCSRPIPPEPVLEVSPDTLDFGETRNSLPLTIINAGGDVLRWSIQVPSEAGSWLSVDQFSGSIVNDGTNPIDVRLDRDKAPPGYREVELVVTGGKEQREVVIKAIVQDRSPILNVEPLTLDFGSDREVISLTIRNIGGETLHWTLYAPAEGWVRASRWGGKTSGADVIDISIDRRLAPIGRHEIILKVVGEDNSGEEEIRLVAEIHRTSGPEAFIAQSSLEFGCQTQSKGIVIQNIGTDILEWEVTVTEDWLAVEPAQGQLVPEHTETVRVSVDHPAVSSEGPITTELVIMWNGGHKIIPVTLCVEEVAVAPIPSGVAGVIRDITGQPVPGVAVLLTRQVDDPDIRALQVSTEDGSYSLKSEEEGRFLLQASAERYLTAYAWVELIPDQEIDQDIQLIPLPEPAEIVYDSGVPYRILLDPTGDGDRAYVLVRTEWPDNLIKVVSGVSSRQAITSQRGSDIQVGTHPVDGAFWGQNLLVACYGDTSVWMVDLNTNATRRIATSLGPYGMTVEGDRGYVVCEGSHQQGVLDVIDLEARAVIDSALLGEVVVSMGDQPWGPDVSVHGSLALVTDNQEAGKVLLVDLASAPPQVNGHQTAGGRPQRIVAWPTSLQAYVVNKRPPVRVTVLDRLSGTNAGTISVSDAPGELRALALAPEPFFDRRLLYLIYPQSMVVYDLDFEMEVGQISLTPDRLAQVVSATLTPDGYGLLIGLERAPIGERLLFLRFEH